MKTLTAISFFVFSTMAVAQSTDQRLEAFNRSPAWENSSGEASDNPSLVKPFQGKKFICRDETSFTPKENDTASAAFAKFVEYDTRSVKDENFFMDADHREQREKLLEAAIEVGSWKARYFDSV